MAEELTKEEQKKKADAFDEMLTNCADAGAKSFEDFLKENPNATETEKHDKLVGLIKANFVMASLMLHAMN